MKKYPALRRMILRRLSSQFHQPQSALDHTTVEIEMQKYILANKIRNARKCEGLTQIELSQLVGFKQTAIARLESRRILPSLYSLIKIARALNKQIEINLIEDSPA